MKQLAIAWGVTPQAILKRIKSGTIIATLNTAGVVPYYEIEIEEGATLPKSRKPGPKKKIINQKKVVDLEPN